MLCSRCSHSNADGNKFCSNCGAFLPGKERQATVGPSTTPSAPVVPGLARMIEADEGTEVLLASAAANGSAHLPISFIKRSYIQEAMQKCVEMTMSWRAMSTAPQP